MYDWPQLRAATDALWAGIARELQAHGLTAPERLDRARPREEIWRDPALLLSQTCGWPYASGLSRHLRLVATPVYAVEGCEGALYSSAIVLRREERAANLGGLAGRRPAINAPDSLSGAVALAEALRAVGLSPDLSRALRTGAHRASVLAVAAGEADFAAIDAVAWRLARDFEAEAVTALKVLAFTPLRPALPFVTARGRPAHEVAAIRAALDAAFCDPSLASARAALHLAGLKVLPARAYSRRALLRA
ncbi:phosphate/phosphite/phosphonate ABC transporter substrate-binding protein [Afifella pfennigii]|uniref:phosphate/phosphite/phosphonate ABC transporter substrate-binding protein n=1 Tax=Afifella pfennigii TaxID=209897 RepID=UPI000558DA6D|nr:PhnD/SsuA/transferrin family substrate-binding protein [Afifella pfennigii]